MELRFYCFVNFYLSQIQQGIQTGHCAVELVNQHVVAAENPSPLVVEWMQKHKTFITLNGGNNEGVRNVYSVLSRANSFPFACFIEDQQSLGGLMTCVGVVLPESVFAATLSEPGSSHVYEWTGKDENGFAAARFYSPEDPNFELVDLLHHSRLA